MDNVRLDVQVGTGGFADVFRGSWGGRQVAIKKLHRFNAQEELGDSYQVSDPLLLADLRLIGHRPPLPEKFLHGDNYAIRMLCPFWVLTKMLVHRGWDWFLPGWRTDLLFKQCKSWTGRPLPNGYVG